MEAPDDDDGKTVAAAASARATTLRVRAVTLEVTRGQDEGRTARIDRPLFVIGSGEGADMRLSDTTVSREHLRLALSPAGIRLRDEGSKNGTFLGGVRVADVTLTADAQVELGSTTVAIHLEAGPLDLPLSEKAAFGDAIGVSAAYSNSLL